MHVAIATYDSILPQISKENKKFEESLIKKGAKTSIFGDFIDWLIRAGIVIKCDKITRGDVPLAMFVDLSSFKLCKSLVFSYPYYFMQKVRVENPFRIFHPNY